MRTITTLAVLLASGCTLAACGAESTTTIPPDDTTSSSTTGPRTLPLALAATMSGTGLYADIATLTLASDVQRYQPASPLWSDGAVKERYVWLPDGQQIDTSDMDHWVFPTGARLWKEFRVEGRLVETRHMVKVGGDDGAWLMAAYVWNADGTEATRVAEIDAGADNDDDGNIDDVEVPLPSGATWSVPAGACMACHRSERDRALGFSAVLLAHDDSIPGVSVSSLVEQHLLSSPPSTTTPALASWTPAARAAALTMQANCAHCHQPGGSGFESTGLDLRTRWGDADIEHTQLFITSVNVATMDAVDTLAAARITPGHPEASALVQRMSRRDDLQMPMLGSQVVDDVGVATVSAWIATLE